MSYSDCLETKRLHLGNKGKACIKGSSVFDLDTVVMEADLRLTGSLNGNTPDNALCGCLRPTQIVVDDLVGFWRMWDEEEDSNESEDDDFAPMKFANYDSETAHRIAVPSTKIPTEGTYDSVQLQFNPGKEADTFIHFFENNDEDEFIASFDMPSNRITYLPINSAPDRNWCCIVYDPIEDRYLGYEKGDNDLYAFDTMTGAETYLSDIDTSFEDDPPTDSVIINNTGYISFTNSTISLTRFDRATGAWIGDIDWSGSYIFSGTNFIDAIDLSILGMGLDTINFTLHLLLKRDDSRYLGSVSANTLGELETLISSGIFDITLAKYLPTDRLDALLYLN